jgi:hypothetical protein
MSAKLALHFLPYILLILISLAWRGNHAKLVSDYERLEAEFTTYRLQAAELNAKASQEALQKLQEQQAVTRTIEHAAQQKAISDASTIVALRHDFGGMRIHTRCPTISAPALSTAFDPGISVGAGSGEVIPGPVQGADAADLLADYALAEQVRAQLIACTAVIRSLQ